MVKANISKDISGRIVVSFTYDPLLVSKIKTIEGRRWHPVEKHWSFPDTDGILEKILEVFGDEEIHLDPVRPCPEGDCPRFTDYLPLPSPSMGEGKGGGEEVRIGTVPEVCL